eukprot:TRINITY_DN12845_c0_g1_i2.p1 TRINITY_DN12845_c0_g1~~TRINITY_DN12845_c0_g1_i2.p1  ORF type:complete len:424 (+),score=76.92 TRINITY_DN12845_c0_g1_i2:180-1451(+)
MCTQQSGGAEDCLFINIFTPVSTGVDASLPVYVYVHGGGFVEGSGELDGRYLSGKDIIVVSLNYRLSTLGFLALEALMNISSQPTTGYYGIQDQRAAFAWVKDNIHAFGGNPDLITIGGESAGGNSVCIHLTSPRSGGMFVHAIMESGPCGVWNWTEGIAQGNNIVDIAGCKGTSSASELECMYKLSPAALVKAFQPLGGGFVIYPTMHNYEITEYPLDLFRSGRYNKVPLLAGTNLDEAAMWTCGLGNVTAAQEAQYVLKRFGTDLGKLILQEYPVDNYAFPLAALTDLMSDMLFKCITRDAMLAITSSTPSVPNYMYSFEHVPSFQTNKCFEVAHTDEVAFIFGVPLFTPAEAQLSAIMRGLWVSFIATGTPSGGPVPWQKFNITQQNYLILDLNIRAGTSFRRSSCTFWDAYPQDPAIQP